MNLYQKIVEVRKVAEGFKRDGASYGYTYVTGNQVLGKIKDKMNELNLLLFPSTKIGEHHTHAYKTAKGKDVLDFVVKGEMSYTWINGDEPTEREVVSWAYYGQQDDISKAFGSALTYSERYFLLKCLGLPTDEDDPDAKWENGGQSQTQSQPRTQTQTTQTNANTQRPVAAATSQSGQRQTVSNGLNAKSRVLAIMNELKWDWNTLGSFASDILGRKIGKVLKDIETEEEWHKVEEQLLITKQAS